VYVYVSLINSRDNVVESQFQVRVQEVSIAIGSRHGSEMREPALELLVLDFHLRCTLVLMLVLNCAKHRDTYLADIPDLDDASQSCLQW